MLNVDRFIILCYITVNLIYVLLNFWLQYSEQKEYFSGTKTVKR